MLSKKNLSVVYKEFLASCMALQGDTDFISSILQAINSMLINMLAAITRKAYEDPRHRQQQSISKAKV